MFRYVVSYERWLSKNSNSLTKHERVYFRNEGDAESWLDLFRILAKNCFNFTVKSI